MDELLSLWDISSSTITPITDGLINGTFKVDFGSESSPKTFILQRINQEVFHYPEDLMSNHQNIEDHLSQKQFLFKGPIWETGRDGGKLQKFDDAYWRLGPFFEDTQSHSIARDANMAWNIGRAFGQYDKDLLDLSTDRLKNTITEFHNLPRYLDKLSSTIKSAPTGRLQISKKLIDSIDDYLYLAKLPFPKNRVIHNDAKVSNLLFQKGEVYAVIDWDTTMAGHISWEYADLFRTTVVNVPEDHPVLSELSLQYDMLDGLNAGYKSVLFDYLSSEESDSFYHGALYLIFEQAVRFLEDYLAGDLYYKCNFDDHNFIRARNQFCLLALMVQDEKAINNSIQRS